MGGVLEHGARNRQALALAAGKFDAVRTYYRVVAHRHVADEGIGGSHLSSFHNIPFACVHAAIGDIGAHRIVEQHNLLADERHGAAQ